MKISANISLLFNESPMVQRIGAAKATGFDGVEILFPYDDNAAQIAAVLKQNQMPLALINCPPPNYTGGSRGFAAIPSDVNRFERDLKRVLRYADKLNPEHIHIMAGVTHAPQARDTFITNLRFATQLAPQQSFTIEPLNPRDMPGYFLTDFENAIDIIQTVDAPNLGLQYDSYHAAMITGNALETWHKTAPYVRHIQIGDAPDRSAPGTGSIDFKQLFQAIIASDYDGWVSAEYNPQTLTEDSLEWLSTIGQM